MHRRIERLWLVQAALSGVSSCAHRLVLVLGMILGAGASGCSCGADIDLLGGLPVLCVAAEGSTGCQPDGSDLDWGAPPAGALTELILYVSNTSPKGTSLEIGDVRVTDSLGAGRLFDVALCQPACDVQRLGLPAELAPGATAQVVLTFDAQLDAEVPAESLEILSNSSVDDVAPPGIYLRTFVGVTEGCLDGRTDANGDKRDGCECAPSADGLETCDGLDNDCDGDVDEEVGGSGIQCDTALPGICELGSTRCIAGEFVCSPQFPAEAEVCDGLDNDCDGDVDEENTWFSFNDGLSGGNIAEVAHDPRTVSVVYALTGNRIYRSGDGGSSFDLIGEAPYPIKNLAFPPENTSQVFGASLGGLLVSDDGGATWSVRALSGFSLASLLIHPADSGRILVGTHGGGIYRSTNGGQSFVPVNQGVPFSRVSELAAPDSTDPDFVVAAIERLNDQGAFNGQGEILKTTNGGANWTAALTGVGRVLDIASCASDASVLFAASYQTGLLQSLDGGTTWSLAGLAGDRVSSVGVAPSDCLTVYAATEFDGIYYSEDGAATLSGPMSSGLDMQRTGAPRLSVDPATPSEVVMGNHSGAFVTSNAASSWIRSTGLDAAIVRALDISQAAPDVVWMSSWGQGLWRRQGMAGTWQRISTGSLPRDWSFTVRADDSDSNRVMVGSSPDLWASSTAGSVFAESSGPQNVFDIALHPTKEQVIYVATQVGGVWRSSDSGQTFEQANQGLPEPWPAGSCTCRDARAIAIDESTPDTLYLGTQLQGLFVSFDGAQSWQATAPELSGETIGCLVTLSGGDLLACAQGEGIWRSDDGAASFSKVAQGMAALNNTSSIHEDLESGAIFATADGGVYRSQDGGASWEDLDSLCVPSSGTGSPAVVKDGDRRLLLVGTGGVGVYALELD